MGVALWMLWAPMTTGAIGAGSGGLNVALGTSGGAPGAAAPVEPNEAKEVTPDPVEAETAEPELQETEPPQEITEAEPVEPLEPEPELTELEPIEEIKPEEVEEAKPIEPEPPEPVTELAAIEPTEIIEAKPQNLEPKPTAKPKVPAHMIDKNKPKKVTKPKAQQPAKTQPKKTDGEAKQAAEETGDTDGQETEGTTGDSKNTGQAQQATAGGNPGARRDYQAEVSAILARNKRYPRRAQSRRQEGIGQLHFVVLADGTIVTSSLRKSSGHRLLDNEILEILSRVGSLPPFPDDIGVAQLEFVVPIHFQLN
ncbi:MAG: energy transducer TonB [Pseudomonadota bacterium]